MDAAACLARIPEMERGTEDVIISIKSRVGLSALRSAGSQTWLVHRRLSRLKPFAVCLTDDLHNPRGPEGRAEKHAQKFSEK